MLPLPYGRVLISNRSIMRPAMHSSQPMTAAAIKPTAIGALTSIASTVVLAMPLAIVSVVLMLSVVLAAVDIFLARPARVRSSFRSRIWISRSP